MELGGPDQVAARRYGRCRARPPAFEELGRLDSGQRAGPADPAPGLHQAARPHARQPLLDAQHRPDVLTPRCQNTCVGLAGRLFCAARPIGYPLMALPGFWLDARGLQVPSGASRIIATTSETSS